MEKGITACDRLTGAGNPANSIQRDPDRMLTGLEHGSQANADPLEEVSDRSAIPPRGRSPEDPQPSAAFTQG